MLLPPPLARCLLWFSTLVTALLHLSTPLLACAPPPPDLWFSERIATVATSLPAGVGVRVVQMTRDDRTSDFVEITNRSPTPLYILAAPADWHRSFTAFPMALPPRVGAIYQIVNGQIFTWDSMLNQRIYPAPPTESPQTLPAGWVASQAFTWDSMAGWVADPSDAVFLTMNDNNVLKIDEAPSYGESVVLRLASRNRTGDARPANVSLPATQNVTFPLIAGAQLIQVPLTVSYVLNPSYRPDSIANPVDTCGQSTIFPRLILCLIVVGVLVIAGLAYWLLRTRTPTTSAIS